MCLLGLQIGSAIVQKRRTATATAMGEVSLGQFHVLQILHMMYVTCVRSGQCVNVIGCGAVAARLGRELDRCLMVSFV